MQLLDREVGKAAAMVIDGNLTSRSVIVQNLRDFGFGSVRGVGRVVDARDILEKQRFDVVICDYHFESGAESGQDLLEELRREQLLPHATVFVMITGEATYQKVAEAAEAALDSYLVKPFSANALLERLREARQRKRVLSDIFAAMDAGEYGLAAQLCLSRFESRQLYWLYAARIGAELLLNLKRNAEAQRLYDAVIAAKTVPWARLGVARAQLAEGDMGQARRTLDTLLGEMPQFADSYDVLGKVQLEQGQLEEALATYRTAVSITPGCLLRMQHLGTLSFYGGDATTAAQMLDRAWLTGSKSRLFDVLSMLLLSFLRFDANEGKALAAALEALRRFSLNDPQSARLKRMADIGQVLVTLQGDQVAQGIAGAREAVQELHLPEFDMEAGTNLLSLWTRLDRYGIEEAEFSSVVHDVARRFSVSKASTEVLAAAVRGQPRAVAWIREAHAEVLQLAEAAMNHALRGDPRAAVETLLQHGRKTGNAKLIEMAGLVARRHQERITDVEGLLEAAGALAHRYCSPATHMVGLRRSGRSVGGMALRR